MGMLRDFGKHLLFALILLIIKIVIVLLFLDWIFSNAGVYNLG